jgi:hypothetical protein
MCLNIQKVAFFVLRKRKAQWAAITDPKATADLLSSSEDGSTEEAPVQTESRAPIVENGAFAPQKIPQKSKNTLKVKVTAKLKINTTSYHKSPKIPKTQIKHHKT